LVSSGSACDAGTARVGQIPDLTSTTGEPEVHQVTVGALPITDLKQYFVADAEGFFRREGLEVTIKNFGGGAEVVPAVMSEAVHIGWSNTVSILQARARGLPVRFFAGGVHQGPGHWTSAIMVPADSPVRRAEDLRGRTIAINNLGNINELVLRAYLDRAGVGPGSAKMREIPLPDQPAALQRGRVDAAIPVEPFVTVARQQGARTIDADPFAVIGSRPLVAAFFADDDWLRENPKTAAAFRRAVNAATRYWNEHPDQHAGIIARYTKVELALATQIEFGEPSTELREQDLRTQVELSYKYGLLPRTIDAHEVLTR
jgi:NitT/TauT family transport system substrate-binding protein